MIFFKDFNIKNYDYELYIGGRDKHLICNDIFTFDTETSTLYIDNQGNIFPFDKTKDVDFYKNIDTVSWVYIWMFSINDIVLYGRTLEEFKEFLDDFYSYIKSEIVIYVHNLGFDFHFLRNIYDFSVFARKKYKPMKSIINNSMIEFRDSYILSNQSLENIGKHNVKYKKMVGDLDYLKVRFCDTILSKKEMGYCENDCLVLYEYILSMKNEYEKIKNIPLTQTGKVRKKLQEYFKDNKTYNNHCKKNVPNLETFKLLKELFQGGYTHANPLHVGDILYNVHSRDFASSYPFVMLTEKYPISAFTKYNIDNVVTSQQKLKIIEKLEKNDFLWFALFKFKNIKSTQFMNYISYSKIRKSKRAICDNGKLDKAEEMEILLTNVDFEIIKKIYIWEDLEINDLYIAKSDYMDNDFRRFVVKYFINKTRYKNDKENEDLYARTKEELNGLYGMAVTNLVAPIVEINENEWKVNELNDKEINKILEKQKKNTKTLTIYSIGIFITAYARRNIFNVLLEIDSDVIYCDTDSVKYINNHDKFFIEWNENIKNNISKIISNVSNDYPPKDKYNNTRYLGTLENDGEYFKFKTLGSKKYCYVDDSGLHITTSGVNKNKALKDKSFKKIEDFKIGKTFGYEYSGRSVVTYNENQKHIIYKGHIIKYKYGISIRPTTYTLGISQEYDDYINSEICDYERKGE